MTCFVSAVKEKIWVQRSSTHIKLGIAPHARNPSS